MMPAKLPTCRDCGAEIYRGIEVLPLRTGDPLPTPSAPGRWAVHTGPDLARYLLTFNPPNNRNHKPRKIRSMASDMAAGRWIFSPQSVCFSFRSVLQNGQNTLEAVIDSGCMTWLLMDFGWPDETVYAFDHNTARTNADTLHIAEVTDPNPMAAIASLVWRYEKLVGTGRSFDGFDLPSSTEVLGLIQADPAYAVAGRVGARLYLKLQNGCSRSVWGAAYYLIAKANPAEADAFFDEVAAETGPPQSATRDLAKWFLRRNASAEKTRTGDRREPLELVIRAFNAWMTGKALAFPRYGGFSLSRIYVNPANR